MELLCLGCAKVEVNVDARGLYLIAVSRRVIGRGARRGEARGLLVIEEASQDDEEQEEAEKWDSYG